MTVFRGFITIIVFIYKKRAELLTVGQEFVEFMDIAIVKKMQW